MRRVPPLGAVEAFVVGSRARSFRAAAASLALSPSAFSRRIQLLEAFVETALFDRSGPVPVLTPAGERYLRDLESAVETIRHGTDALRRQYRPRPLRVTASLSIATTWLLPRLHRFHDAHPDVPVDVVTGSGTDAVRKGEADVALFGDIAPPEDILFEKLVDLQGVAVASPNWLSRHGPLGSFDALIDAPLLGTRRPDRVWQRWLGNIGYAGRQPDPVSSYDTVVMTYEAASAGMGIALGAPLAAERFVREGRLVPCFAVSGAVGSSYYVAFARGTAKPSNEVRYFAEWLGAEARRSQADLSEMLAAHTHLG